MIYSSLYVCINIGGSSKVLFYSKGTNKLLSLCERLQWLNSDIAREYVTIFSCFSKNETFFIHELSFIGLNVILKKTIMVLTMQFWHEFVDFFVQHIRSQASK